MIGRRRFLTVAAAMLMAGPGRPAPPLHWRGRALGAEVGITLHAPSPDAARVLDAVTSELTRIERRFSLFDPSSELSRLNARGRLVNPSNDLNDLLAIAGMMHHATGGRFDPTVQPLWRALSTGGDTDAARRTVGWGRVVVRDGFIELAPGQALTLNGIAQGFATDRIAALLRAAGFDQVLVNIGEFSALGGPWRIGVEDPQRGLVAVRSLANRSIATSSPGAMRLGAGGGHIVNPRDADATPLWSTVSVEADSAALADAASTALCLMTAPEAKATLRAIAGQPRALLVPLVGPPLRIG